MPTLEGPFVQDRPLALDRVGERPFWAHFGPQDTGVSLLRESGVWSAVNVATNSRLQACDDIRNPQGQVVPGYFIGGHVYEITSAIAAELTSAGFGAHIT